MTPRADRGSKARIATVRLVVEDPALLLDFLQRMFPDSSRTSLRGMLQVGRVRINGEIEKQGRRALVAEDVVDVGPRATQLLPEDLSILYEDEDVIVVVKDVGLLTVATPMERERTVQAYLNDYLRAKRIQERIHVVHRLDRDTSGVLVFAKRFDARETLKEQFARHDIERLYIAIIEGAMPQPAGTIRSYVREDADFTVRSVSDPARGKLAVTHYRTLERGSRYSRLEVRLETGRKNQIRAHLSEAGHPVVGDERYGAGSNPMKRLGLHAAVLGFAHPTSGKPMRFEAPLPDSFRRLKL